MADARPEFHDPDRPIRFRLPEAFRDDGAPCHGPKAVFFVRKDLEDVPSLVSVEPDPGLWRFDGPPPVAAPAHDDLDGTDEILALFAASPDLQGPGRQDDRTEEGRGQEQASRPDAAASAARWPTHNYGNAYRALTENRSVSWTRRIEAARLGTRRPAELWDVDELAPPARPAPMEATPDHEPPPYRAEDVAAASDPAAWLAGLDAEGARVGDSGARILRILHGASVAVPVLDESEVLHASRPHDLSQIPAAVLPEDPALWRNASGLVGSGVLVLLVLLFLQLVFF